MPQFRESGKLRAINQLRGQLGYKPYAEFSQQMNKDLENMIVANSAQEATLAMARAQGREGDVFINNNGLNTAYGLTDKSIIPSLNLSRGEQHIGTFAQYDNKGVPIGDEIVKTIQPGNTTQTPLMQTPSVPALLPYNTNLADPIQQSAAPVQPNVGDIAINPIGALSQKYPWLSGKLSTVKQPHGTMSKQEVGDEVKKNAEMWKNSPFGKMFGSDNSKKEGK